VRNAHTLYIVNMATELPIFPFFLHFFDGDTQRSQERGAFRSSFNEALPRMENVRLANVGC